MSEQRTCENCGFHLEEQYNYCPNCGMKCNEKLTLRVLFNNTIANYFSVDARFFKSFFPLLIRPGFLPKIFVEGKRLRYLHPAQTYLFISVVFFFLFSLFTKSTNRLVDKKFEKGIEAMDSVMVRNQQDSLVNISDTVNLANNELIPKELGEELNKLNKDTMKFAINNSKADSGFNVLLGFSKERIDSAILAGASEEEKLKIVGYDSTKGNFITRAYSKQLLKFYEQRGQGFLKTILGTIPIAMFFLLPVFAFVLKLLHWRKGPFSYHVVFSFYFFSFVFLLWTILVSFSFLLKTNWLWGIAFVFPLVYLFLAIKKFYGQGFWMGLLKTGVTFSIYTFLILPFGLSILLFSSMLVY